MYYTNTIILYSFLGFCLESTVYKISKSKRYSGICYGPITYVYGFGILALTLLKEHFLDKLKCHKILKLVITFLTAWIALTIIEWLGGHILHQIFDINMWNYTKKPYNFGKYICLELSLIWGLFGTLYVYYLKDFFDQFLALIPKKLTLALLAIQALDITLTLINKLP